MKKYLTEKEILISAFNFQYAGIANIFISKNKNMYQVCYSGFSMHDDIFFFNNKSKNRESFYTLHNAIIRFNELVKNLCSTADWFEPDFFKSKIFYKQINKDVY